MILEGQLLLRCGCEMKNSVAMNPQVFFPSHPQDSCRIMKAEITFSKITLLLVFLLRAWFNTEAYEAL